MIALPQAIAVTTSLVSPFPSTLFYLVCVFSRSRCCSCDMSLTEMDAHWKAWLQINRNTLLDAHYRLEELLDELIIKGIFHTNEDDYQVIMAQDTSRGQLRKLLEILPLKKGDSFRVFESALSKLCPQIIECCVTPKPPKSRMEQLCELLSAAHKSKTTMRPMPWLGAKGEVCIQTFSLDLIVVDHDDLAKAMNERASTTASEQKRRDHHNAQPQAQDRIPFESLFRCLTPARSHINTVHAACTSGENAAASTQASHSTASDVISIGEEASAGARSLCARRKTAVWAGAGCGKTGTCHHIARLHSEGQLWPFFDALLLWRLREPAVQSATSLVQLLAILLPDVSENKLQEFSGDILERKGRGILAVLDGVDEFVQRDNSYVCRLLNGEVLTEACLLATSRPCEAARQFFNSSVFNINVELLGFSERQVDTFIDERLNPELAPKLKGLLDRKPSLASLMSVPLLALLVCQIFSSTSNLSSLSTTTRLYSSLMLLVLRHAVDESRIAVSDGEKVRLKAAKDARQLPMGMTRKLLTDHAKIAWSAHKKDKAIFDTDFILGEAEWESLGPLAVGLLDCYISAGDDLTEVRHYSFQHLTVQEFLTAFFLAETTGDDHDLQATLTDLCKDTHSYVVLQFLAGLLKKKHHSIFFSHLNRWLHDPHLHGSARQERLHVCLLCALEACEGDVASFPDQLKLPGLVNLGHVTAADLATLSTAVKKSSDIKVLELSFDWVREESDAQTLSRVKRQTRTAMTSFTTAVSHNRSLCRLGVYGPKYNLLEEKSLANLIRNNRLDTLRVDDCGVVDLEMSEFSFELQRNTTLRTLFLHGNTINEEGMHALADALTHSSTLHTLSLCHNIISATGMHGLADALTHNIALHALHLNNDRISDAGTHALAGALTHNTTLHELFLSDNRIGDAGMHALANALTHNSTLHTLSLSGNVISEASMHALADTLARNNTLHTLSLSDNMIGDAGMRALADALTHNSTLHKLWLFPNHFQEATADYLCQQLKHISGLIVR